MHDEIAAAADLFGLASYKNVYLKPSIRKSR